MPSIWRACVDSHKKPKEISRYFKEPIERMVFEKLREDNIAHFNSVLVPTQFEQFISQTDDKDLGIEISEDDKDSLIIVIHWIGNFLTTCYYP